jgi:hypothetical protein
MAMQSAIEREPFAPSRASTAMMLGFVPCDPSVALPVLRAVVAEDENFRVRAAANYAVRLIERRGPPGAGPS